VLLRVFQSGSSSEMAWMLPDTHIWGYPGGVGSPRHGTWAQRSGRRPRGAKGEWGGRSRPRRIAACVFAACV